MSESDVALVTGGTSGIGRETVRGLAERGWTVLVHGRDRARGEQICAEVANDTPGDASFYRAELADFDAVRGLAATVADEHEHLDALLSNAGTWQGDRMLAEATGQRSDSTRGKVQLTMAVNHCGHFLLTHELWPQVAAANGRVVTVSSGLHERGQLSTDRFVGPDGPSGQQAYADSKLANVAFTRSLARRAAGTGVTATACHPGVVPSSRLARESAGLARLGWKLFGVVGGLLPVGLVDSEREAAGTSLYLTTADATAIESGAYFAGSQRQEPKAVDEATERHLWEWTADVVGVDPDWPTAR